MENCCTAKDLAHNFLSSSELCQRFELVVTDQSNAKFLITPSNWKSQRKINKQVNPIHVLGLMISQSTTGMAGEKLLASELHQSLNGCLFKGKIQKGPLEAYNTKQVNSGNLIH